MKVTNRPQLGISYRKSDGSWTNPRNFGPNINFGLGSWGPWITPDNKYLFYTTGTKPDYSDVYIYWFRIDGIIDSLKHYETQSGSHRPNTPVTHCSSMDYVFSATKSTKICHKVFTSLSREFLSLF
jgi:hypothetical protein